MITRKHKQVAVSLYLLPAISNAFAPTPQLLSPTSNERNEFVRFAGRSKLRETTATSSASSTGSEREFDVVVIGAGIGGLSCAALAAKYGLSTLCLEAHDTAGGCAHSFDRYSSASRDIPFKFDSGPSLCSGLSSKSLNPLRQVMDAVGVADDITWHTYDGWVIHDYADGKSFRLTTGNGGEWENAIEQKAGAGARRAFEAFKEDMLAPRGLSEASGYIPPFALRGGPLAAGSLAKYALKLLSIGSKGAMLTGPFTKCMEKYGLTDDFNRKWFDYLAFALSGLDAAHTQAAPVAYMMKDLHGEGAVLDYPMGGMGSLIETLAKGLTKNGGQLEVNSRVEKLILEDENGKAECKGVVLHNGEVIRARKGVVSNAPLWNMARLLEESIVDDDLPVESVVQDSVREIRNQADKFEMTGTFMHLHLGIPCDGLENLECHYSVLNMDEDIMAKQNLVIISIPTVFDPSLAPDGYHVVHAYTAASENFDEWEEYLDKGLDSGNVRAGPSSNVAQKYSKKKGYEELKEERAEALWKAIEQFIPDVRERAERKGAIKLVGTPLTHRRYNQRYKGTYGPAPPEGKDVWELKGALTPISNLLACGDACFPGIGLPGVAASGTIAANSLVGVRKQMALMKELRNDGALQ